MATQTQLDEIEGCLEAMARATGRAREGEIDDEDLWGELEAQCQLMAAVAIEGDDGAQNGDDDEDDDDDTEDELRFDDDEDEDEEDDERAQWTGSGVH